MPVVWLRVGAVASRGRCEGWVGEGGTVAEEVVELLDAERRAARVAQA